GLSFNPRLSRTLQRVVLSGFLLLLALMPIPPWFQGEAGSLAQTKEKGQPDKTSDPDDLYSYIGGATCSGSACHGSTSPRSKLRIAQNEFYTWSEKDEHSKAYDALTTPDSRIIAKNLKIAKPEESNRCLVCHALHVKSERQGKLFDVTEGVSCEACHGPADKWLGAHTRSDWDSKKAAEYGMYNTKDLAKRADRCLECHAGSEGKVVDHELIGAGHPRLKFEIDNYSHAMPAHWIPPKDKQARQWLGTRAWATGQVVALRSEMKLLISSRRPKLGPWPDFAHFECFACHHSVVDHLRGMTEQEKKGQRWRFIDYDGKPGRLVWNASSYAVIRHLVNQISLEQGKVLDELVKAFREELTSKSVSPDAFAATLTKLSELTERLLPQIAQYTFSQQTVLSLMRSISGDGRFLAGAGFQSAEQAVMALASLYDDYVETIGPLSEPLPIKETIEALYKDIKDGGAFSPAQFEVNMNKLHGYLSKPIAAPPPS
ncbi:MAG: multiheme c-type cytochrome, partial [Candidatus Methylomirabilis sp.]